jgi:hypothetical protein
VSSLEIAPEWALWSKRQGTLDDYGILDSSDGELNRADFREIISRFSPGTLPELPQVTIGWVSAKGPFISMAIHERTADVDGFGRPIVRTRCFGLPYAQVGNAFISYESLYEQLMSVGLPVEGALRITVPELDPESIADNITDKVRDVAAVLLVDKPVSIIGGERTNLRERLRFLDAVVAALPYGLRTNLSAATWADSATEHKIRISFSANPRKDAFPINWDGPVSYPSHSQGYDMPNYWLSQIRPHSSAELVRLFARATDPISFRDEPVMMALRLLEDTTHATPISNSREFIESRTEELINACAEFLKSGQTQFFIDRLKALDFYIQDKIFSQKQRIVFRDIIQRHGLLNPRSGIHIELIESLYRVMLRIGYGPNLELNDLIALLSLAGGKRNPVLLEALLSLTPADVRTTVRLAAKFDDHRRASILRSVQTEDLVSDAVIEPIDVLSVRIIIEELIKRSRAIPRDPKLAESLHKHGYLDTAIQALRLTGQDHYNQLQKILFAAYGENLELKEFEEIVGDLPGPNPGMVIAAAVGRYGPGAGDILLKAYVFKMFQKSRVPQETLKHLYINLFTLPPQGITAPPMVVREGWRRRAWLIRSRITEIVRLDFIPKPTRYVIGVLALLSAGFLLGELARQHIPLVRYLLE